MENTCPNIIPYIRYKDEITINNKILFYCYQEISIDKNRYRVILQFCSPEDLIPKGQYNEELWNYDVFIKIFKFLGSYYRKNKYHGLPKFEVRKEILVFEMKEYDEKLILLILEMYFGSFE